MLTGINPATGEQIAEVPVAGAEDVDRAVAAARGAFAAWSNTTPGERQEALLKLADAVEAHADELAEIEARNAGKPLHAMREDEMPVCVDNLRFFAGAARNLEGRAAGEYLEGYTSWTRREPVGVVAQITPWNYPLMMAIWKLGPALATGNTIVLKPAETTPLSTLRLAELAREILPEGVLNAGQDCTAATRVLAGARLHDDVVEALAEQATTFTLGDTFDPATTLGPLNSARQHDNVSGFLERRPDHTRIVTGGKRPDAPGFFLEPTVVDGLRQDDEMVQQEIFGPVITVQRFDDEAKALEWANGTPYGLEDYTVVEHVMASLG